MTKNDIYGAIIMERPAVRRLVVVLSAITTITHFFVAWMLGVSLWGLVFGVLVASALSYPLGAAIGVAAVKAVSPTWATEHLDTLSLVTGITAAAAGYSMFIGLSATILVLGIPLLFTLPASYGLRAWAICKYQDDVLWESTY